MLIVTFGNWITERLVKLLVEKKKVFAEEGMKNLQRLFSWLQRYYFPAVFNHGSIPIMSYNKTVNIKP